MKAGATIYESQGGEGTLTGEDRDHLAGLC